MMTEHDFAKKLTTHLDRGLRQMDGVTLQRLTDIRGQALARAYAADRAYVLAQHGRSGQLSLQGGGHRGSILLQRPILTGIFLIILMAGMVLWQQFSSEDDTSEQGFLDAQMLSGDLAPSTFIQPDFKSWLSESHESR